jgi:hypothetical protein
VLLRRSCGWDEGLRPCEDNGNPSSDGSAATLARTGAGPVAPGETIVLRIVIFDEGDYQLDSPVALDDVRWLEDDP